MLGVGSSLQIFMNCFGQRIAPNLLSLLLGITLFALKAGLKSEHWEMY